MEPPQPNFNPAETVPQPDAEDIFAGLDSRSAVLTHAETGDFRSLIFDLHIGSGAGNNWQLEGDDVADTHVLIKREKGKYVLINLGENLTTLINDVAVVSRRPLTDGDIIRIGRHVLRFEDRTAG